MKKCIVTGAAGFTGANLVELLVEKGYFVYALVRPGSSHNKRLMESDRLKLVPVDYSGYGNLPELVQEKCDIFFHLTWQGGRYDFAEQYKNIDYTLDTLEAASRLGCSRFVCTGSQAEYGPQREIITEEAMPYPTDAYGAAKLAACVLTRQRAAELGMEWIWGRIFSLYGKYEPMDRMLPALLGTLREGGEFAMNSDGSQNWDYLHVRDAAEALIALGEKGRSGEIYNIAHGEYQPLRRFVEAAQENILGSGCVKWKEGCTGLFSLQPAVEKIQRDTGWGPRIEFAQGILTGY